MLLLLPARAVLVQILYLKPAFLQDCAALLVASVAVATAPPLTHGVDQVGHSPPTSARATTALQLATSATQH